VEGLTNRPCLQILHGPRLNPLPAMISSKESMHRKSRRSGIHWDSDRARAGGGRCFGGGQGFTLTELLVTTAVIGLLAGLVGASSYSAMARARRISCLNNLRQLGIASTMYSGENSRQAFSDTRSDSDDNQSWAYPYVKTVKPFLCPAAKNTLNESEISKVWRASGALHGMIDYAGSRTGTGSSYEVYGFMNYNGGLKTPVLVDGKVVDTPGIQKTAGSLAPHTRRSRGLGMLGQTVGPSSVFLFLDGDSQSEFNRPRNEGNHGATGSNVQFCDGSARFINAGEWIRTYELSQDEGVQP
jgi:prepilin-type N-terminal cleavage/methylation domain-containing protein